MFRSEPMQKVRIVCLQRDRKGAVAALHRAGIIDLRKSRLELSDDSPENYIVELSNAEIRLAGAIALLAKPKRGARIRPSISTRYANAEALVKRILETKQIEDIYGASETIKRSRAELGKLQHSRNIAAQLSGIPISVDGLTSGRLSFKAFSAPSWSTIKELKKEAASDRKSGIEIIESRKAGQQTLVMAYRKGLQIDGIVSRYKLKEIDMSGLCGMPSEFLSDADKRITECKTAIASAESALAGLSASEYANLAALMEMLKIEMMKAQAGHIFKRTDKAIVIEGWVPVKRLTHLDPILEKEIGKRYYIEELKADELAPTLMNRPKLLQPFDYMINFLSVPRSDEIDPAMGFMLSFPVFYGLMVSDVGYGIASFIFSWYITKITDPEGLVYNTAKIWQLSAVAAVFFGFLSNQYFGLQLNQYFTTFKGFDWLTGITSIITIAVVFGIVQVAIGLFIGFINEYHHHRKLAFGRLASMILVISGSLAIAGGLFGALSATLAYAFTGIAIASLVAMIVLSGQEAAEVTNLISHPLSYARIMGFGLASIVLAFLIDKAFTPNISAGLPLFLLYMAIFIILHFLNMIVTMFEGAVQAARLNFIEYFTKFYRGGGVKFMPFQSKRVYTKENT